TSKLAKDMLGETVITDGGEDTVASVTSVGVIPLVYVSGGGVTIMAGADPTKRIGSHNGMKP
ncbi:MAG TPA: hypothetical protein VFA48_00005, partial [Gammaproteobacteria bacterium]|nr:hypothetical protein [Gammaproteobacteria bacterium]